MALSKLSNEEWLILMGVFSDDDMLRIVKKELKTIDAEHILGAIKIIEPDDSVRATDVAYRFREITWPLTALIMARLETDGSACQKYDVRPIFTEQASKYFNCLSLQEWKKLASALQDEVMIACLKRLFTAVEDGRDFSNLPKGVKSIIDVARDSDSLRSESINNKCLYIVRTFIQSKILNRALFKTKPKRDTCGNKVPGDLDDLLKTVRAEKNLPNQRGLIKYDYKATWDDLTLPVLFLGLPLIIYGYSRIVHGTTLRDILSYPLLIAIFYFVIVAIMLFLAIAGIIDWLERRAGKKFILLTPKYLVNVYAGVEYYEWVFIEELCVASSAKLHEKDIKVNEAIHNLNKLDEYTHLYENVALNAGHRKLVFNYKGHKKSVGIPDGVDIKTLASFIKTYWMAINPQAKRKDILYL